MESITTTARIRLTCSKDITPDINRANSRTAGANSLITPINVIAPNPNVAITTFNLDPVIPAILNNIAVNVRVSVITANGTGVLITAQNIRIIVICHSVKMIVADHVIA